MKKIINLTPHDITIMAKGEEIIFRKSGKILRLKEEVLEQESLEINGIPVVSKFYKLEEEPRQIDDTVYLVSSMMLPYLSHRGDCFSPDTGETAIRDDSGRIQAVTRLVCTI